MGNISRFASAGGAGPVFGRAFHRNLSRQLVQAFFWGTLFALGGLWWYAHADAPGHATASAFGWLAQWALLWLVIVMSRIPVMWAIFDQRRVIEIHQLLGRALVGSAVLHVVVVLHQSGTLTSRHLTGFTACLALAALFLLILTSVTAVHAVYTHILRINYPTWFWLHRSAVIVPVLSIWHELRAPTMGYYRFGPTVWISLHIVVVVIFVYYRVFKPIVAHQYHRLVVVEVEDVVRSRPTDLKPRGTAPDRLPRCYQKVTLGGRHIRSIEDTQVHALGYANVRFPPKTRPATTRLARWLDLRRWLWWVHGYSYSVARPSDDALRLLIDSAVGDSRREVDENTIGRRVVLSGFFGQMTRRSLLLQRAVVFASGQAIDSALPLMEDLHKALGGETLQTQAADSNNGRVHSPALLICVVANRWHDITDETRQRLLAWDSDRRLVQLVALLEGADDNLPSSVRWDRVPQSSNDLDHLIRDIDQREIYLTGSRRFCDGMYRLLRRRNRHVRSGRLKGSKTRPAQVHREHRTWDPPADPPVSVWFEGVLRKRGLSVEDLVACALLNRADSSPAPTARRTEINRVEARLNRLRSGRRWAPSEADMRTLIEVLDLSAEETRDLKDARDRAEARSPAEWLQRSSLAVQLNIVGGATLVAMTLIVGGGLLSYRPPTPQVLVELQSGSESVTRLVKSPVTFTGKTRRNGDEQLWLLIKPPKDAQAVPRADILGLYKVAFARQIVPDEYGNWSAIVDLGGGKCDETKTYEVTLVRSVEDESGNTVISRLTRVRTYPEFPTLPSDTTPVYESRVTLWRYLGQHHFCPVGKQ